MARHAVSGEFRAFFWGMPHGGTLEAAFLGPILRIFGYSTAALRWWEIFVAVVTAVLVWVIARMVTNGRTALLAVGIFFLFPSLAIVFSTRVQFVFQFGVTIALTLVACALWWHRDRRQGRLWWIGLLAGLCIWLHPLLLALVVPVMAGMIVAVDTRADLWRSVALAPIGAAPWLWANVTSSFSGMQSRVSAEPILTRIEHAVTVVLPGAFTDASGVLASSVIKTGLGIGIMAAVIAAFEFYLRQRRLTLALIAASILIWPVILGLSGAVTTAEYARYSMYVWPGLAVLAAIPMARIRLPATALVLLAAVTFFSLSNPSRGFASVPAIDPALRSVAARLEADGRRHVFAAYWVAFPLAFASEERVHTADLPDLRYEPWYHEAIAAPRTTFVFFADRYNDRQFSNSATVSQLADRIPIGRFVIYEFRSSVKPSQLPAVVVDS
jgi:hypothetical protein